MKEIRIKSQSRRTSGKQKDHRSLVRCASVQFDLRAVADESSFWKRVAKLCSDAKKKDADLILFPEYFPLSLLMNKSKNHFPSALKAAPSVLEKMHSFYQKISDANNLVIVAGTIPYAKGKKVFNRSYVYYPEKKIRFQDKEHLTRFEQEEWGVSSGENGTLVFKWKNIRFGIAICYDVEFPKYIEKLLRKKIDVILVPSCTEDIQGYWRVRHCAEARAVETQSYVVISSIVGGDPRFSELFPHHGQALFLSPCDTGFSEGGLLASGNTNIEGVWVHSLDIGALYKIRRSGTVLNREQLLNSKS